MIHIALLPTFHSSVGLLWKWGDKSDCIIKLHSDIMTGSFLFSFWLLWNVAMLSRNLKRLA